MLFACRFFKVVIVFKCRHSCLTARECRSPGWSAACSPHLPLIDWRQTEAQQRTHSRRQNNLLTEALRIPEQKRNICELFAEYLDHGKKTK